MAAQEFVDGLARLGFEPRELQPNPRVVAIEYSIPLGPKAGERVELAFAVPGDFPLQCPSGPHVKPHILPFNSNSNVHPTGGVHAARDGVPGDFQYWSRPYPGWAGSDRSVRTYMSHIHHLFDAL